MSHHSSKSVEWFFKSIPDGHRQLTPPRWSLETTAITPLARFAKDKQTTTYKCAHGSMYTCNQRIYKLHKINKTKANHFIGKVKK